MMQNDPFPLILMFGLLMVAIAWLSPIAMTPNVFDFIGNIVGAYFIASIIRK